MVGLRFQENNMQVMHEALKNAVIVGTQSR